MDGHEDNSALPVDLFGPTRWSMVLTASDSSLGSRCHQALSELCQSYWFPVFAYLRRKGYSKSKAEDLTQTFFAGLLEKKSYTAADPDRGRFRAFLIAALKNFLHNAYRAEVAQKRGGGVAPIHLDAESADGRYIQIPDKTEDPEFLFDRAWAQSVVEQTLARLKHDYLREGHEELFNQLANGLTQPEKVLSQAQLAEQLGLTEAAVKSSLQRLRKRYRWILRNEIAQTTAVPQDVDGELRHLIACLT